MAASRINSKQKGSAFEREIGRGLSLWLTHGERGDLFSRNVGSGSRFTIAEKAGRELAQAGDLMAAHHLAFDFMDRFIVEAKHYKSLEIPAYFSFRGKFLNEIIRKTAGQAKSSGKHYLIIAKQNNLPAFVITTPTVGAIIKDVRLTAPDGSISFCSHVMYERDFVFRLADMHLIDPDALLSRVQKTEAVTHDRDF